MASVAQLLETEFGPGSDQRLEREVLMCHCLNKPRSYLYTWPEAEVPGAIAEHYAQLLQRRQLGEPVAYLTGFREFWSLSLKVNQHTLIPRPETELLVEWALQLPLSGDVEFADMGTGCGAIALALASEKPAWQGLASDASEEALAVTRGNIEHLNIDNVRTLHSDWFAAYAGERFHLLLSNPPYVASDDAHLGQGDLRFEPRQALTSGLDGLDDIRRIIDSAAEFLLPGGWLLLEHGYDQGAAVRELLHGAGFSAVASRTDLAGIERVSGGCHDHG